MPCIQNPGGEDKNIQGKNLWQYSLMTCCFIITLNKNIDRVGCFSVLEHPYNYFLAELHKEKQVCNMFCIEVLYVWSIPCYPKNKKKGKKNKSINQNKINFLIKNIISPNVTKLMRKANANLTVLKNWECSGDRKLIMAFFPLLLLNAKQVCKLENTDVIWS